mmetsp:Transcript_33127/g.98543  ORF Transcript_33127/g.98543 Transcript_33127/m.98543 type:complete len:238 (+) Transcript_33127:1369-2082(+)
MWTNRSGKAACWEAPHRAACVQRRLLLRHRLCCFCRAWPTLWVVAHVSWSLLVSHGFWPCCDLSAVVPAAAAMRGGDRVARRVKAHDGVEALADVADRRLGEPVALAGMANGRAVAASRFLATVDGMLVVATRARARAGAHVGRRRVTAEDAPPRHHRPQPDDHALLNRRCCHGRAPPRAAFCEGRRRARALCVSGRRVSAPRFRNRDAAAAADAAAAGTVVGCCRRGPFRRQRHKA